MKQNKQSKYRNCDFNTNLTKLNLMKEGFYDEGKACLCLKIDMKHEPMHERASSLSSEVFKSPTHRGEVMHLPDLMTV